MAAKCNYRGTLQYLLCTEVLLAREVVKVVWRLMVRWQMGGAHD